MTGGGREKSKNLRILRESILLWISFIILSGTEPRSSKARSNEAMKHRSQESIQQVWRLF